MDIAPDVDPYDPYAPVRSTRSIAPAPSDALPPSSSSSPVPLLVVVVTVVVAVAVAAAGARRAPSSSRLRFRRIAFFIAAFDVVDMARASAGVETPQERAVHVTSSDARPRETSRVRVDDECERSDDDADAVVARRRRRSRARAGRDEVAADEDVNCASAQSSPFGVVVDDDCGDARARRGVDVRTARARRIDAAFCGHARAGSGRFAARG